MSYRRWVQKWTASLHSARRRHKIERRAGAEFRADDDHASEEASWPSIGVRRTAGLLPELRCGSGDPVSCRDDYHRAGPRPASPTCVMRAYRVIAEWLDSRHTLRALPAHSGTVAKWDYHRCPVRNARLANRGSVNSERAALPVPSSGGGGRSPAHAGYTRQS